jgi:hypothetical protein
VPTRRDFLRQAAATSALLATGTSLSCSDGLPPYEEETNWSAGDVAHLLPAASHDRILLKASFHRPLRAAHLQLAGREFEGRRSDAGGLHYSFDARALTPDRTHTLQLRDAAGDRLCDPWPLRTLPAPNAAPRRLRILLYTCAGGPEHFWTPRFEEPFIPIALRRRLLARALSFQPDVAIANGDHVYWDLHSKFGIGMANSPQAWWRAGWFDQDAAVLGGANEEVLRGAVGPQIAGLYGTLFRSTPMVFLQDDHDHLENDEADEERRTFPPTPFMVDAARATQKLYYPELFAGPELPRTWSREGLSESFGSLRYGRLFEALLYDCRRHLTNRRDPARSDEFSGFVPADIEAWLIQRTRRGATRHCVHVPSTPILWSAGKWGEWYPDVLDEAGDLRADQDKPYWPSGWKAQHDRLLEAASARRDRIPLFASGDLHALGLGRIHGTGDLNLSANPVVSLLVGPPGTGELTWPSRFRGTPPLPSRTLEAEEWQPALEANGFTLLDVTPDEMTVRLFRWKPEEGIDVLPTLEPFLERTLERPA